MPEYFTQLRETIDGYSNQNGTKMFPYCILNDKAPEINDSEVALVMPGV